MIEVGYDRGEFTVIISGPSFFCAPAFASFIGRKSLTRIGVFAFAGFRFLVERIVGSFLPGLLVL